jgi:hypothetical protein
MAANAATHAEKLAFLDAAMPQLGGALRVPVMMGGGLVGLNQHLTANHRVIGHLVPRTSTAASGLGQEQEHRSMTRQEILSQRIARPEL